MTSWFFSRFTVPLERNPQVTGGLLTAAVQPHAKFQHNIGIDIPEGQYRQIATQNCHVDV